MASEESALFSREKGVTQLGVWGVEGFLALGILGCRAFLTWGKGFFGSSVKLIGLWWRGLEGGLALAAPVKSRQPLCIRTRKPSADKVLLMTAVNQLSTARRRSCCDMGSLARHPSPKGPRT